MSATKEGKIDNAGAGTNSYFSPSGVADSMRDMVDLQLRTAQFMMDKSLSFGQSVVGFYQNQLNESVKLTQECAKFGWGLTENAKNTAFEYSDRVFRRTE